MALYEIDGRGPHYDDLRAGAIASVIANVHRNTKVHDKPFSPLDFMSWNEHSQAGAAAPAPVLLDDPEAQSKLMLTMLFPNKVA